MSKSAPERGVSGRKGEETPRDRTNAFIASVRATMSPDAMQSLPADTAGYIDAIVRHALTSLDAHGPQLTELVRFLYHHSPTGERFIRDPIRNGTLFINADGDLVSMEDVQIGVIPEGRGGAGMQYIRSYSRHTVLTGPNTGKRFTPSEQPLPPLAPSRDTPDV